MVHSQMLTKEELFVRYGRGEALHVVYSNELRLLRAQIESYDATLECSRKCWNNYVECIRRDEPEHISRAIMYYGLLGQHLEREIRRLIMRRDES